MVPPADVQLKAPKKSETPHSLHALYGSGILTCLSRAFFATFLL